MKGTRTHLSSQNWAMAALSKSTDKQTYRPHGKVVIGMHREVEVASNSLHFNPAIDIAAFMFVKLCIHSSILLHSN